MHDSTVPVAFRLKGTNTKNATKIGTKRKRTAHEYTDNMIKVVASCYPALCRCPGWEGVAVGGAAGRRTAAPPPVGGDLGAGEGGAGPSPRPAHGARLELFKINRQSCTITEKAPTRAFSWSKAPTSAFTFKTFLRHYNKQALTPW